MKGRIPWHAVVAFLLATSGTIGAAAVTDPPRELWGWVLFVLSVIAVTGAGTLALYVGLAPGGQETKSVQGNDEPPDDPAPAPCDRHSRARKVVLIVLVAALTGGLWYVSRPLQGRVEVLLFGCEHPTQVSVLTTPELLETYRDLVDRYERVAAERNHDCRPAELYVYAPPVAKGLEGLKAGWTPDYLRDSGPRPNIWLPDTSLHVEEVRAHHQKLTGPDPELVLSGSIASTPIVLGMPVGAGARPGDKQRMGQTWATLVSNLKSDSAGLIRPALGVSTVGEFGTVAIYTSENLVGQHEDLSLTREFEQWVDRSLAADGYPADADTVALMRTRSAAEPPGQAVVVSELALVRFNQEVRRRSGRGCDASSGPADCLLAFYPSDTYHLDLPFVPLRWPDEPPAAAQQAAAENFGNWLTNDDGQRALVGAGLRPPTQIQLTEPLTEASGVLPRAPRLHPAKELTQEDRDATMRLYEQVRRPEKVLISVDASGSMLRPAGQRTRFAVALDAVRAEALAPTADVQFTVFSQTIGVQPVGRDDLDGVRPTGNTPLYRAIVDGVRLVGSGGVLVVVTDGVNNVSDVSPQQLVDQAGQGGARVLVLAFGEGNCAAQALMDVASRTGGSCRQSTVDSLPADLANLLQGR